MNPIQKSVDFAREVRAEGNKIAWPDRKTTVSGTVAVIVFVAITATFMGITDFIIGRVLDWLIS